MKKEATKEKLTIKFSPFAGATKQGREVTILIPKEVDGEPVPNAYMDTLKQDFAEVYGGYTITEVTGGWVSPKADLIEEKNYHFVVVFDVEDEEKLNGFIEKVKAIKSDLNQQCMYIKVEHDVWFV